MESSFGADYSNVKLYKSQAVEYAANGGKPDDDAVARGGGEQVQKLLNGNTQ